MYDILIKYSYQVDIRSNKRWNASFSNEGLEGMVNEKNQCAQLKHGNDLKHLGWFEDLAPASCDVYKTPLYTWHRHKTSGLVFAIPNKTFHDVLVDLKSLNYTSAKYIF